MRIALTFTRKSFHVEAATSRRSITLSFSPLASWSFGREIAGPEDERARHFYLGPVSLALANHRARQGEEEPEIT